LYRPLGDKSAYTDKQVRQAHHIEDSLEQKGLPHDQAVGIAWATVNKQSGGGLRPGHTGYEKMATSDPNQLERELTDDGRANRREYVEQHRGEQRQHQDASDLYQYSSSRHLALEDYLQKGGKIITEHPNKRGDETIVVEMPDGARRAFANVKPDTLQKMIQKFGQDVVKSDEGYQPRRTSYNVSQHMHYALEDYLAEGGRVISQHPNKWGDETIVVELPDGRRQAFSNIRPQVLQTIFPKYGIKYEPSQEYQQPMGQQYQRSGTEYRGVQYQQPTGQQYQQQPPQYRENVQGQAGGRSQGPLDNIMRGGGKIVSVVIEMPSGERSMADVNPDVLSQLLSKGGEAR